MFLYVMSLQDKCFMEQQGYEFLYERQGFYVFKNKEDHAFADLGVNCIISDTLTF